MVQKNVGGDSDVGCKHDFCDTGGDGGSDSGDAGNGGDWVIKIIKWV